MHYGLSVAAAAPVASSPNLGSFVEKVQERQREKEEDFLSLLFRCCRFFSYTVAGTSVFIAKIAGRGVKLLFLVTAGHCTALIDGNYCCYEDLFVFCVVAEKMVIIPS